LSRADDITVVVTYAPSADDQRMVRLRVPRGATVEDAIRASGLLAAFPAIDLAHQAVGIFGERVPLTRCVEEGERVEIYRPLTVDPKQARRARARSRPRR
jgi:putative ubiquitin-RnfH superfamily antitoxin RatB of RatAB toxin-antitoxin module